MQSAALRMPSRRPSIALGAVGGAVKPVTVTCSGRVGARERRQACVMLGVALGLIRRMEMGAVEVPVIEGRSAMIIGSCLVRF